MAATDEKDQRFKKLELKVGLLVAVALAGLVVIAALVGMEKDLFSKKYRLNFVAPSGAGLVEGMPVKLSGFKVGRVKRMELTDDARVMVSMEIKKKYGQWLREGARARLVKEAFIGEGMVELTVGDPSGRLLEDGQSLPFEKAGGIDELVSQAKPVLNEVKEIIEFINNPDGDFKATLANMRALTGELKGTSSEAGATLREARGMIRKTGRLIDGLGERAVPLFDAAGRAMDNASELTRRLGPVIDRVESVAATADSAMIRVDEIAADVKKITGALSGETPRMRQMLIDAADAARDGKDVMGGVRRSWPVRLMMPPAREPALVPLDGFVLERGGDEIR